MLRKALITLALALALVAAFFTSIIVSSETAGEVVTVITTRADGDTRSTRLWVVDDGGHAWLRAGVGRVAWVEQAEAAGELDMVRDGATATYGVEVLEDATSRARIHALMRAKYGARDRYIDLIRDGAGSIAIRLDPLP